MSETTWTKEELTKLMRKSKTWSDFVANCPEEITPAYILLSPEIPSGAKAIFLISEAPLSGDDRKGMLLDLARLTLPIFVAGEIKPSEFGIAAGRYLIGEIGHEAYREVLNRSYIDEESSYRSVMAGRTVIGIINSLEMKSVLRQANSLYHIAHRVIRDMHLHCLLDGEPLKAILSKYYL